MELGTCNGDREFPISQIQIGGDTFVGDTLALIGVNFGVNFRIYYRISQRPRGDGGQRNLLRISGNGRENRAGTPDPNN